MSINQMCKERSCCSFLAHWFSNEMGDISALKVELSMFSLHPHYSDGNKKQKQNLILIQKSFFINAPNPVALRVDLRDDKRVRLSYMIM